MLSNGAFLLEGWGDFRWKLLRGGKAKLPHTPLLEGGFDSRIPSIVLVKNLSGDPKCLFRRERGTYAAMFNTIVILDSLVPELINGACGRIS